MRIWALLLLGAVIATGTATAGGYIWYTQAITTPADPNGSEQIITIPKGVSSRKAGQLLIDHQLVSNPLALKIWLKLASKVPQPKAGRHKVSPRLTIPELFKAISSAPISEDLPLTLVEGWRLRDADEALAARGLIQPGDYMKAAKRIEDYSIPFPIKGKNLAGYLLPETYRVPPGPLNVKNLIQRQIDAFNKAFYFAKQRRNPRRQTQVTNHRYYGLITRKRRAQTQDQANGCGRTLQKIGCTRTPRRGRHEPVYSG